MSDLQYAVVVLEEEGELCWVCAHGMEGEIKINISVHILFFDYYLI